MADELLNAVVRLEAEIQQQLEQEQARAAAWLAGVRKELAEENAQAVEKDGAAARHALQAAEDEAKQLASALVAAEMRYCQSLEEIDDEMLLEVLGQELLKVLPEQRDDHQDGES